MWGKPGTDGTDPDFSRQELGERPVCPHIPIIARNTICEITINGHTKLLALRGNRDKQPHMLLDSTTRHELDVENGCTYDVEIHTVSWFSYWKWAWGAADPGYRLAMQISLISFALGLIGLILGLLPLITHH